MDFIYIFLPINSSLRTSAQRNYIELTPSEAFIIFLARLFGHSGLRNARKKGIRAVAKTGLDTF